MMTSALNYLLDLNTEDDDLYRLQLIRNWWSEIVWQFTQELEEEYRRILAHSRREFLNRDDLRFFALMPNPVTQSSFFCLPNTFDLADPTGYFQTRMLPRVQ